MNDSEKRALEYAARQGVSYRCSGGADTPHARATASELRELFDVGVPEEGREASSVIEDLVRAAESGLVGNIRPDFFAWVMGGSHPAGVAADWLTSSWGQNAAIYQCSPAAATAEEVAAKWLLDLLRLPDECSVGFTTGATMASFIALAAARSDVLAESGWNLEVEGLHGAPAIKVFIGEEAHSSVWSALRLLGFGRSNYVMIGCDDQGRMLIDELTGRLEEHQEPKVIVCQAGHINSGAFDNFVEIAKLAATHSAWLHVDGAFGLWANAVPNLMHLCAGVELADSWAVDGHKWLQVPYDSGFAIVKDANAHRRTMDITASYLNESEGDGRNPTHFVPELSRRARGFAVWAVIQALGRQGIREIVSRHCACAARLAEILSVEPGIEILNEVCLNQIALTVGSDVPAEDREAITKELLSEIEKKHGPFLRSAKWKDQTIVRISIISPDTTMEHIEELAQKIQSAHRTLRASYSEEIACR
ncbi:MAG: aspartate aminotransferase family protein [Alphaproteobacteria bacterium]|nr:aspartate aminotransferase family protein [Alphaproteobacteria bacterium]